MVGIDLLVPSASPEGGDTGVSLVEQWVDAGCFLQIRPLARGPTVLTLILTPANDSVLRSSSKLDAWCYGVLARSCSERPALSYPWRRCSTLRGSRGLFGLALTVDNT